MYKTWLLEDFTGYKYSNKTMVGQWTLILLAHFLNPPNPSLLKWENSINSQIYKLETAKHTRFYLKAKNKLNKKLWEK